MSTACTVIVNIVYDCCFYYQLCKVSLWQIPQGEQNDGDMADYESDREPKQLCEVEQKGDVTGLEVNCYIVGAKLALPSLASEAFI